MGCVTSCFKKTGDLLISSSNNSGSKTTSAASSSKKKKFTVRSSSASVASSSSSIGADDTEDNANETTALLVDNNDRISRNDTKVGRTNHRGSSFESSQSSVSSMSMNSTKQVDISWENKPPHEVTPEDEILLEDFYKCLQHGTSLHLHKAGKKKTKRKNIKIFLDGNELKWQIKGILINKYGTINMGIVNKIIYGRVSEVLKQNDDLDESLCFSMVTREYTIDLECSSREERDTLARGFTLLISHIGGRLQ